MIAANLEEQRARVASAAIHCGRDPGTVRLVAISKTQPARAIRAAYEAGQRAFGENYADELAAKRLELADLDIEWHFTGHLQSNKARVVAPDVDLVHSVDRPSIVDALDRAAHKPLDVLIQVRLGDEETKSGCAPEDAKALVDRVVQTRNLRPVGLMVLPPPVDDPERARPWFRELRMLRDRIAATLMPGHGAAFTELSMGMSHDAHIAINEGATLVRIGTAIFGTRSPQ